MIIIHFHKTVEEFHFDGDCFAAKFYSTPALDKAMLRRFALTDDFLCK